MRLSKALRGSHDLGELRRLLEESGEETNEEGPTHASPAGEAIFVTFCGIAILPSLLLCATPGSTTSPIKTSGIEIKTKTSGIGRRSI